MKSVDRVVLKYTERMKYLIHIIYGLHIWNAGNTLEEEIYSWTLWLQQNFASVVRCSALKQNLGYITSVLVIGTNIYAAFWVYATFLNENHAQVSIQGNLLGWISVIHLYKNGKD